MAQKATTDSRDAEALTNARERDALCLLAARDESVRLDDAQEAVPPRGDLLGEFRGVRIRTDDPTDLDLTSFDESKQEVGRGVVVPRGPFDLRVRHIGENKSTTTSMTVGGDRRNPRTWYVEVRVSLSRERANVYDRVAVEVARNPRRGFDAVLSSAGASGRSSLQDAKDHYPFIGDLWRTFHDTTSVPEDAFEVAVDQVRRANYSE